MNCLVLGSQGQIGAPLCQYLKKTGHGVLTFDLAHSFEEDLRIKNNPILLEKMQQADFVFFLAFDVGGSLYLNTYQHTMEFISNNTKLMQNTFEVLHNMNKPFIFSSSQMSNMMFSPYGVLKALGELYTHALNGLVVKFWNVYGAEHDLMKTHVITDFIHKARKNRKIDMLTDGLEKRQFLYADDCSECLVKLAEQYKDIPREKELHITSFHWNSVLEIAHIVAGLYEGTTIQATDKRDQVQRDLRNEPDPFILKYWKPKTSLQEGIRLVKDMI